ncbi:hypothetical protein [Neptuniibacter caesariensis]|uniref:Uncharacterized protein n=1 Tax=Neptuniibacter caesariensis TaxID=207954 RepID=A0A7U8CA48_NEPCE|nr:hypothetical protein [Neptuniibacter caesariensis]EAR62964.1 hypothetical protein MED92_07591 [Oceanospirillum sp. MED92] [Neptuniibacter caesariensis]
MARQNLYVRIKPELKTFLKEYADSQDISSSRLIENMIELLKNAIDKEEEENNGKT